MTQFAGFFPRKEFTTVSGMPSHNLDSITEDQTQGRAGVGSRAILPAIAFKQPTATSHRNRNGMLVEFLASFLYNRIHLSPRLLALGNVIGVQKRDITVWNANFTPRTLSALLEVNAEGIDVTNQTEPPLVFAALEEKTWNVQVSSDGPPTIDATLTWQFEGEPDLPVHVTGSRVVIWSFYPTWEGGITETLEWKTDVLTSPLGDEQRRSLRLAPRRGFKLQLIANEVERRYMELLCFSWSSRNWAIPIWNHVQETLVDLKAGDLRIPCQTYGRDFRVGGLLLLRGADAFTYESAEISAIDSTGINLVRPLQSDWPIYTKVYPIRTARFSEQPTITRLTDRAVTMSANFLVMEVSDWAPWPGPDQYMGRQVFRLPTEESESLNDSYIRMLQSMDNGSGLPTYYDSANLGFLVQSYRWVLYGRDEQAVMRSLLYFLRGQFKSIFVPTHKDDLTLAAIVSATGGSIDVEWSGYSLYGAQQPGKRDIMITLLDGTVYFRRITGSAEVDQNVERLSLNEPFGREIRPEMVNRISYMALMRLTTDSVEILHQTDSDGVASSAVVFRSIRDDIA